MKQLLIEVDRGYGQVERSHQFLFNTQQPDWGRVTKLLKDEMIYEHIKSGDEIDVSFRIRLIDAIS